MADHAGVLEIYLERLDASQRQTLLFRPFDKPKDLFYEANAGRLGLLGPGLVSDIVYVYGHINGFRMAFGLVQTHGTQMADDELRARLRAGINAIDRATERGRAVQAVLRQKAEASFLSTL